MLNSLILNKNYKQIIPLPNSLRQQGDFQNVEVANK